MKFTELHAAVEAFRESKDPRAFRYIYETFSGKLYYVCLRYLKNEADAQDVLQEAFVTAYHKIDSFSGSGSLEGWIRRIVVNGCLGKLRLDQKTFAFNGELRDAIAETDEDTSSEQAATEARLMEALHALPVGYRTILNLAVLEDYSHKEIGELLGISESTSRSQLSRAKTALKDKLERP